MHPVVKSKVDSCTNKSAELNRMVVAAVVPAVKGDKARRSIIIIVIDRDGMIEWKRKKKEDRIVKTLNCL